MQRSKSTTIITIAGIIAAGIIAVSGAIVYANLTGMAPTEDELPASTILANQQNLNEVKAFLNKYPNAEINVDRSGRLALDYRVDQESEYLRLRVFADNEGKPQEMFVECFADGQSRFTHENITNYCLQ